jgi:hypothetical protein
MKGWMDDDVDDGNDKTNHVLYVPYHTNVLQEWIISLCSKWPC